MQGTVRRPVRGHLHNVAPAAFVQMIAIERETCALGVHAEGRQGTLFFVAGELRHAEAGELYGEEAALLILGWDLADVETQSLAEPHPHSINAPLTFILLEAMRRRDERAAPGAAAPSPQAPREGSLAALVHGLDGVSVACLIDLATGIPLEEHLRAEAAFEPGQAGPAIQQLVATELALLAALGGRSRLHEIVLTSDELLVVIQPLEPELLLAVAADPARVGLPALRSAIQRLGESRSGEASPWRG